MKILSMQATFGKLENEVISFQPGLNVIHAPNEWGKSTWCAFMLAMLYGIDTSSRSKKDFLADKERFAPWSGSPMAGSMDVKGFAAFGAKAALKKQLRAVAAVILSLLLLVSLVGCGEKESGGCQGCCGSN